MSETFEMSEGSQISEAPAAVHLRQLAALDRRHRLAPKVALIARSQLGVAVEEAFARRCGGWIGWTMRAPEQYARSLLADRALRPLPRGGLLFLTARVLESVDEETRVLLEGPNGRGLVRPLSRSVETLRTHGVAPAVLEDGPPRRAALGRVLRAYEEALAASGFHDAAATLEDAARRVAEDPPPELSETVLAVFEETELPGRAERLVRALEERTAAVYRIGPSASPPGRRVETPPLLAGARLADWPRVEPASGGGESGTFGSANDVSSADPADGGRAGRPVPPTRFMECAGAETEVREVMRRILEEEIPLEEVEIAYAASDPYLTLLAEASDRYDIPLTVSTGRPALSTGPAQALRGLYDWITEEFDVTVLIRLLRGGLLRLHRRFGADAPSAARVASVLAEQRYEPGREGYEDTLAHVEEGCREHVSALRAAGDDAVEAEERLESVRTARELVDVLLTLVPRGRTSVAEMAELAESFLEEFGPVDRPDPDLEEGELTQEEQARQVLVEHVQVMQEGPAYEAPAARIASRFRELLAGEYLRAERPAPGRAHVVPLEGAGYGDRPHLFVVGLDAESMESAATEDALLLDREREEVAERGEVRLPLLRDAPDAAAWTAVRALERHVGPRTLTARVYDVESGEELTASSVFLRLRSREEDRVGGRSARRGDRPSEGAPGDGRSAIESVGLAPPVRPAEGSGPVLLEDAEAWLGTAGETERSGGAAESRGASGPEGVSGSGGTSSSAGVRRARRVLADTYPWILAGREAARERGSDAYTAYDGLLPDPPYPELDFLDPGSGPNVLSASRLELLAEAPYLYFLQTVLGVEPLEEPALEETGWLDAARRGSVIHGTLERFMTELGGRPPTPEDRSLLLRHLEERIEREKRRLAPPNEAIERAHRRRLREDVLVFLGAELARRDEYEARYLELGFGLEPSRTDPDDRSAPATLDLGEEGDVALRGRIDRIDRHPDGSISVWDYKTGGRDRFTESDALRAGQTLQWALYAAAAEQIVEESGEVRASGYYFASTQEMGARLSFAPEPHRRELAEIVRHLAQLARSGSFPMNADASGWVYGEFDRICPDRRARRRELRGKEYPPDRPRPPHLQDR